MKVRVLQVVQGSGPFGEMQADSKIFTLEKHPPALALGSTLPTPSSSPARQDVDIGPGGLAFVIDNILSPEEADLLASVSERVGYSRFAPAIRTPPGMRQNKAAHWVASEDTAEAFLRPLYSRFRHLLPLTLGGSELHDELSHRVAHYKYEDGDVFNRHTDGCWPGQSVTKSGDGIEEWSHVESKLTMLLYLNDEQDGVQGGHTRLFPFSHADPVDVVPRKGSALFFRHGFERDSVMHMGMRVSGSTPKYVVRLNVLYREFA
jgi:hypothetical protein